MAWVATGASVLGTAFGIYQGVKNQNAAEASQARLDKLAKNSPIYKPDKSIHDYYQQALNRYNENPFTSPYYLESVKQANRATGNAIGAMQSRRGALGTIGKIDQASMDAKNRAIAGVMQNKNTQFSQLGSATNMQGSQAAKAFDINQLTPYKTRLGLTEQEMASQNEQAGAGWQNAISGISNIAAIGAKGIYGDWYKTH
jgi:hypothetical protein